MGALISLLHVLFPPLAPARPELLFGDRAKPVVNGKMTLENFVKAHVPSLLEPYTPAWWCPTGHGQTIYCAIGDFTKHDEVRYERKMLRLVDGGTIGLDFTLGHAQMPEDTPVIVVKHGLTGGSYESYVRAVLARACGSIATGGLGYRGVVCNFRGCAGVPVTSAQFYSAGHTDDLRAAVSFIRHLYPKAKLLGIGFSLGANVMTRYLAEEGVQCRLAGATVLACPWDVVDNSKHLEGRFLHRHVYSKAMARNLVRLFRRHVASLASLPPSPHLDHITSLGVVSKVQDENWVKGKTLQNVDDIMVCNVGGSFAPHGPFPFPSAKEYYQWASSHHVLPTVRVPLLALSSSDDPIVHVVPKDCGNNPYVCIALTHGGGHLGWFEDDGTRWVVKPVLEWFKALAEMPSEPGKDEVEMKESEDGFWREVGREHIGWKVLKDGELVVADQGATGMVAGL
ncbi:AB-hydrolase YheT [Exidia glandulosa HHB12029]|uniref:AB-hydrolase YheT n=1 Tax=Exidia glandulosa HHB12029 TaxID=1314781 RepID=A0A165JCS3_EXIGL|nr:AB-hydrolase YheT [Exidia glandulosa HHB12029]